MVCPTCSAENPDHSTVCRSCGSPLPAAVRPSSPTLALQPGAKLQNGAFTLGRVLGQGGFGITYLGSYVQRRLPVALKEFFPQGCIRHHTEVHPSGSVTPDGYQASRDRFLDEARILSQFQHPGIVRVYSSFQENNTAYMAMEYLRGKTLQKLIEERGKVEEDEATEYVLKVGEALAEIHRANLLHRDIKPENILLTDENRIALVDFGSAREFAAGHTKRMTALLTPGYAPLEQYGRQARFGAFTDIYALGATLYHLLTGQPPAPSTDRAAGVTLPSPRQKNAKISAAISDAVMWAMEMRADKRPQSAEDFMTALRGESSPPGKKTTPKPSAPDPLRNPYEARLLQLFEEAAKAPPPPSAHPSDARIANLETMLETLSRFAPGDPYLCPACRKAKLSLAKETPDGKCPICQAGILEMRSFDVNRCPVCRNGTLAERKIAWDESFCPICRSMPLQKERRVKFGLAVDLWWKCQKCRAEFDIVLSGHARLQRFAEDPYGVGQKYRGKTLPFAEWKSVSERSDHYLICKRCDAQLDHQGEDRLKLAHYAEDPYQMGERYGGSIYFRLAWAKLAAGASLAAGNLNCPSCRAEYNWDSSGKALTLVQVDESAYGGFAAWKGKPIPLQAWKLAGSGKRSLRPGYLCPACQTEFDSEIEGERLVRTSQNALAGAVGKVRSLEDWQRWVSGIPLRSEEMRLRDELNRMQQQRKRDQKPPLTPEQRRRLMIETELNDLLKKSLLEGFIPITGRSEIPLKKTEKTLWSSPADRLRLRIQQGEGAWVEESKGSLFLTNERLIYQPLDGNNWERGLSKLESVEMQMSNGQDIGVLNFSDLKNPVAFRATPQKINVKMGNQLRILSIETSDLIRLLSKTK